VRWLRPVVIIGAIVILAAVTWVVVGPSRSAVRTPGEPQVKKKDSEHSAEGNALKLSPERRQALGLKFEAVRARVPETMLTVTGKIAANPDRTVAIVPRAPGRLVRVSAQLGDTVEAGATLALVDSAEAAEALADLTQSESVLALAQADRDREAVLVEQKIGARKDLVKAEASVQQARGQRDRVRGKLRLLGVTDAMVADLQARPGQHVLVPLVAPFRGTVIERQASEGQLLDPAAVPFRLADLSTVWALLDVPETEIAAVKVGQETVVAAGQDVDHGGRVVYVGDVVEEQTRTVKVRVEIPNAQRHVKPGMFVTGRIATKNSGPAALMVPKDAVVLLDDGPVVFVDRGETIEPRAVEVGPAVGGWVPIRRGIAAGENVVTGGAFVLKAQLVKAKLGEE
jgi:cobalt-zinc-cadmium efflux system membrane fusion protein